jgi:TPR repeat protein
MPYVSECKKDKMKNAWVILSLVTVLSIPRLGIAQERDQQRIDQLVSELETATLNLKTTEDTIRLIQLYHEMADAGIKGAYYMIGVTYEQGWLGKFDSVKAFEYYDKSAKVKYAPAIYAVATCKIEGWGTKQDIDGGIAFLQEASDSGSVEASAYLGDLYFYGNNDDIAFFEQNEAMAALYCFRAGEKGDLKSMKNLVAIYSNPENSNYNMSLVPKWIERILEIERNPLFLCALADMYMDGQGVDTNYTRAGELYYEAAGSNDPYAEYQLGNWYWGRVNMPSDYIQVYAWYTRAQSHLLTAQDSILLPDLLDSFDILSTFLNEHEMDSAKTATPVWPPKQ